jgi:hypothetical protein
MDSCSEKYGVDAALPVLMTIRSVVCHILSVILILS